MTPFLGLIASLLVLLLARRQFTQLLFDVLMGLFRNQKIVGLIYGLLFLPGVIIHEGSHWITAKLLRVRTHRFSLIPEWTDAGTLRFGYVEMSKTDHLRAALIGLAPLVIGTGVVLWIALEIMTLDTLFGTLIAGELGLVLDQFTDLLVLPDMLLWFYLLITVSNMMLPSASDRDSWIPVGVFLAVLLITLFILQPEVIRAEWVNGLVESAFRSLVAAFSITAALDIGLLLPIWVIRKLVGHRWFYLI